MKFNLAAQESTSIQANCASDDTIMKLAGLIKEFEGSTAKKDRHPSRTEETFTDAKRSITAEAMELRDGEFPMC